MTTMLMSDHGQRRISWTRLDDRKGRGHGYIKKIYRTLEQTGSTSQFSPLTFED